MKLQEVFDQLATSEFSQLSIGGEGAGVIDPVNHAKVVNHVNLALTTLYTRFNLKEGRVNIPLLNGQSIYPVAVDDLIKIEQVLTDDGLALGLNVASDPFGVWTPSMKQLRVSSLVLAGGPDLPDCYKTAGLTVIYRANHPKVVPASDLSFAPTSTDLELPSTHLMPLLYFVASRVQAPVGMANEGNLSNMYFGKYEAACQELEAKGIQVDLADQNTRLQLGGWV